MSTTNNEPITAPKPKLNSRQDYSKLKAFSNAYARGQIKYSEIPYKYRAHIPEDIHTARNKWDREVKAEKDRYENSNTGRAMQALGNSISATLTLPALEIASTSAPGVKEGARTIWSGIKRPFNYLDNWLAARIPNYQTYKTVGRFGADSFFTTQGLLDLISGNGIPKTYNHFKNGEYYKGSKSLLGDFLNIYGGYDLVRGIKQIRRVGKLINDLENQSSRASDFAQYFKRKANLLHNGSRPQSHSYNLLRDMDPDMFKSKGYNVLDIADDKSWIELGSPSAWTSNWNGINVQTGEDVVRLYRDGRIEYPLQSFTGLPTNYIDELSQKISHLSTITGGKIFGSSALARQGYIPHFAADYDFIVTPQQYQKLVKTYPTVKEIKYGKTLKINGQDVDINVINANSKDPNSLAANLWLKHFPDEYWAARRIATKPLRTFKIKRSTDDLFNQVDPINDTILDLLLSGKDKHVSRSRMLFVTAPIDKLKFAISQKGKMLYGSKYKPLPQLNYTDIDDNKKFLEKLGYSKYQIDAIASDPNRMQLVTEDWYQTRSGGSRGIDTLIGWDDKTGPLSEWRTNASSSGAGLNLVDIRGHTYEKYLGNLQFNLADNITGLTPNSAYRYVSSLSQTSDATIFSPIFEQLGLSTHTSKALNDELLRLVRNNKGGRHKLGALLHSQTIPFNTGTYGSKYYIGGYTSPVNLGSIPHTDPTTQYAIGAGSVLRNWVPKKNMEIITHGTYTKPIYNSIQQWHDLYVEQSKSWESRARELLRRRDKVIDLFPDESVIDPGFATMGVAVGTIPSAIHSLTSDY